MYKSSLLYPCGTRRPPHGGRGLKCPRSPAASYRIASPPARGAWIEITVGGSNDSTCLSPPARGAWIEIVNFLCFILQKHCRPPHGGRGLKSGQSWVKAPLLASPPARGAWIEMAHPPPWRPPLTSPPARGAWIEIHGYPRPPRQNGSPPARGAWIEIQGRAGRDW